MSVKREASNVKRQTSQSCYLDLLTEARSILFVVIFGSSAKLTL